MRYLLAIFFSFCISDLSAQAATIDKKNEKTEIGWLASSHQIPKYLILPTEQKQKFIEKRRRNVDPGGDYILQTYQDLFRLSGIVFQGRLLFEGKYADEASIIVEQIYKGDQASIPKIVDIDDQKCLDRFVKGYDLVFFLSSNDFAPSTPNFCDLEAQETFHPAMQHLKQWEKGISYDRKL